MRPARARQSAAQLDLFALPRQTPDWQTLPAPVRHQTTRLLAQLLQEHVGQPSQSDTGKEDSDER